MKIKNVSELASEISDLSSIVSKKENSDRVAALASECGMYCGVLSMLPDTKENREFLNFALANLRERA